MPVSLTTEIDKISKQVDFSDFSDYIDFRGETDE